MHLGLVDIDLKVPPSWPAAQLILPNSKLPKQNQADSGMTKITVNNQPNQVSDHQPHPVLSILWGSASHPKVSCYVQLSEQLIADGRLIELEDSLMCMTCGASKKSGFAKFVEHLETMHHYGNGYPCPFCEKISWSQYNRRRHVDSAHKKTMSFKQIREMPPFRGWLVPCIS